VNKLKQEVKENINLNVNFAKTIRNKESLHTLENTAFLDCLDKVKKKKKNFFIFYYKNNLI
jgi:hypothetical protein